MGRHPRIEGKALVYYVGSKGRNSQKIFKDNQEKICLINLLKPQSVKNTITFYGYVLLPELFAYLIKTQKKQYHPVLTSNEQRICHVSPKEEWI